jgi:hypothetical protein
MGRSRSGELSASQTMQGMQQPLSAAGCSANAMMRSLGVMLLHRLLLGSAFAQQPPPAGSSADSGYDIHDDVLIKTHDGATLSAKDVSDESLADADGPLQVRWHTDSYVKIPFDR